MKPISRREFSALVAAGALTGCFRRSGSALPPGVAIPVAEVIDRIRRDVGVEWRADTIDTVKAGDPTVAVTGVATTAMATLGVLRQAAAAGANLVVTCEPTFYGRGDARTPPAERPGGGVPTAPPPAADPVYDAKNRFIVEHGLVVFRLCDHWRLRSPDPFLEGLAETLGIDGYRVAGDPPRFELPVGPSGVTLEHAAIEAKRLLGARGGVRVVGDRQTPVRRIALLPGSTPIAAAVATLPSADVVVAGEVREWESVEYARDLMASGAGKGLILVGRVVSEEPGMRRCATWLESIVPEVPVRHIPAGDPYWRPAA